MSNRINSVALGLLILTLTSVSNAEPRQSELSRGSEALSLGVAVVSLGTMSALQGSGRVVIDAVEFSAETATLVLKRVGQGVSEASQVTLKLSAKGLEKSALVVGAGLEVSVVSTGYLLISAGKALAFIPNQVGQTLLHHEKLSQ